MEDDFKVWLAKKELDEEMSEDEELRELRKAALKAIIKKESDEEERKATLKAIQFNPDKIKAEARSELGCKIGCWIILIWPILYFLTLIIDSGCQ